MWLVDVQSSSTAHLGVKNSCLKEPRLYLRTRGSVLREDCVDSCTNDSYTCLMISVFPFVDVQGFSWQPISTLLAALPLCVLQVAAWVPVPNDDSSACSAMCGASMLRTPMSPTGWWGGEHTHAAPCTCFSGSWGLLIGTLMTQDISTEASLCLKYTFKCFVLPNNYSSDALLKTR